MKKGNGTVLIIVEDREITCLLARILSTRFDLITAANGESGLRKLIQFRDIDLVFLEHELSDLDGLKVLHSIRKIHKDIPVALIAGSSSTCLVSKAVDCGITAYLKKPIRDDNIKRVISKIYAIPYSRKPDVECAKEFIEEHLTEKITARDITAVCSVGYRQIARTFKKTFGCTMMQYVKRRRVEEAKKLLIEEYMRTCEVADAVGFSNAKTFCDAFKSLTHMTPRQFQERMARLPVSNSPSQISLPL